MLWSRTAKHTKYIFVAASVLPFLFLLSFTRFQTPASSFAIFGNFTRGLILRSAIYAAHFEALASHNCWRCLTKSGGSPRERWRYANERWRDSCRKFWGPIIAQLFPIWRALWAALCAHPPHDSSLGLYIACW